MLKEEIVGVHRRAVDLFEALCPELPLEARLGVSPAIGPGVAQVTQGALPGRAEPAELLHDRLRVRGKLIAGRDGGAEPGKGAAWVVRVDAVGGQLAQRAPAQLVGDEFRAVRGNADVALTALAFPLADVAGQLGLSVIALAPQVALELDHGSPKQGIDPAADLGDLLFQLDICARDAEAVNQQLAGIGSHGLMARTRGKLKDYLG